MKIKNFEDFVNENYSVNEGLFGFGKTKIEDFEKSIIANHNAIRTVVKYFKNEDGDKTTLLGAFFNGTMWTPESGFVSNKEDLNKLLEYGTDEYEKGDIFFGVGTYEIGIKFGKRLKANQIEDGKLNKDQIKSFNKIIMKQYEEIIGQAVGEIIDKMEDANKKKDYQDKLQKLNQILEKCQKEEELLTVKPEKLANKLGIK